jgi:hypothetical protein
MNPNDPNYSQYFNADGTPVGSGANMFGNTNQNSIAGTPSAVGYNTSQPGQVGSIGGVGKTGGLFGIGNENVQQQLAASGYSPYIATGAPSVTAPFEAAQPFTAGEVGLMGQLQTTAAGGGPSAAESTLRAGTDQNIATQMALAASGRGSPGTMAGVGTAGVLAGQTAANSAAALRAQEIANAQSELGTVAGAGAGQGITQGNDIAGLQSSDWSYLNSLNAGQQGALNSIIGNAVGGANAAQQALIPTAINAVGGGVAAAAKLAAHGAVVDKPTEFIAGEAGKEAIVPIHDDGSPDMARATDPKLKWILDHHGMEKGTKGDAPKDDGNHALLAQIVALRQDIARMSGRA